MAELKPCPFCGGKAWLNGTIMWSDLSKRFSVFCCECRVETPRTSHTKEEAIEAWNRRAKHED